jgi:hypothetical protein
MPRPIELACCTLSCCVRLSSGRPPRPVTNVSKPAEIERPERLSPVVTEWRLVENISLHSVYDTTKCTRDGDMLTAEGAVEGLYFQQRGERADPKSRFASERQRERRQRMTTPLIQDGYMQAGSSIRPPESTDSDSRLRHDSSTILWRLTHERRRRPLLHSTAAYTVQTRHFHLRPSAVGRARTVRPCACALALAPARSSCARRRRGRSGRARRTRATGS